MATIKARVEMMLGYGEGCNSGAEAYCSAELV